MGQSGPNPSLFHRGATAPSRLAASVIEARVAKPANGSIVCLPRRVSTSVDRSRWDPFYLFCYYVDLVFQRLTICFNPRFPYQIICNTASDPKVLCLTQRLSNVLPITNHHRFALSPRVEQVMRYDPAQSCPFVQQLPH